VTIAASRLNRKRVTVDVGQGARKRASQGASVPSQARAYRHASPEFLAASPAAREFGAATPAFAGLSPAGPARGAGDLNPGDLNPGDLNHGDLNPGDLNPGDLNPGGPARAADAQRLSMLAQLGQLHRQGVLTDAEFAAQKAQILSE
jgi:hypothetical protein